MLALQTAPRRSTSGQGNMLVWWFFPIDFSIEPKGWAPCWTSYLLKTVHVFAPPKIPIYCTIKNVPGPLQTPIGLGCNKEVPHMPSTPAGAALTNPTIPTCAHTNTLRTNMLLSITIMVRAPKLQKQTPALGAFKWWSRCKTVSSLALRSCFMAGNGPSRTGLVGSKRLWDAKHWQHT